MVLASQARLDVGHACAFYVGLHVVGGGLMLSEWARARGGAAEDGVAGSDSRGWGRTEGALGVSTEPRSIAPLDA